MSSEQQQFRASSSTDAFQVRRKWKAQSPQPEFDSEGSESGAEGYPVVKIVIEDVRPCSRSLACALDHCRGIGRRGTATTRFWIDTSLSRTNLAISITELDGKPDPILALDLLSPSRRSFEIEGKLTGVCTTFHFAPA
jgi:hypothetical protein